MALPRHEEKTRQGVAIVEHVDERGYVHEQYTNVDECFWGKDPTTCRLRTVRRREAREVSPFLEILYITLLG